MRKKFSLILMIILAISLWGCSKSSSKIEEYLNTGTPIDSAAKNFMPDLDDLSQYQDMEYKYTHRTVLFFQSDSVALIVKYDDEEFEKEKNKLEEKYTFLDEKVFDNDANRELIPQYRFSINSYTFNVVANNEVGEISYPKSFGIIGISEDKKSIAYLYFYDFDLDYIGQKDEINPMVNFVKTYFEYDFE